MHAIIVIPCRNEGENIVATCASLGFGNGINNSPVDSTLILVNNDSTDNTQQKLEQIQLSSSLNTVHISFESEIGYVSPRHHGNILAKKIAESLNLRLNEILIIQADADTEYSMNYIDTMRSGSLEFGENVLLEAYSDYTKEFKENHLNYIDLCQFLDHRFVQNFPLLEDYIVDDKAVAYRLSDYFNWGGHTREFCNTSDEIHAESSRLYMKAQTSGATKRYANDAYTYHSARKIYKHPILHLATAGFPRESSWINKSGLTNSNLTLKQICDNLTSPSVQRAIEIRNLHLFGLFCILPLHINSVLSIQIPDKIANLMSPILSKMPRRTIEDLSRNPGIFLNDIFTLIDSDRSNILSAMNTTFPE